MELTGLEKITARVFDDPELFEVYETARQQVKREEPEPLPKLEFIERWTRIQEIRTQWKELFENWPREREPKSVGLQLRTLKAEEWRLLEEIQGERKVNTIASTVWLSQKVGSLVGYCVDCGREREYALGLVARIMERGLPRCKCKNRQIRLRAKTL